VLRHPLATMLVFLATVILNIDLYVTIPKGFFPQQDTGRIVGGIRADQSISFQAMRRKFRQFMEIVRQDPAVESVAGFTGGFSTNSGFVFATLKPLSERKMSADQVIARLRPKLAQVPGANLFLAAVQDIRVGGRQSNAQYQFTLQADSLPDLYTWAPKLVEALRQDSSVITDVDSDQQQRGLQVNLTIDRDAAARLGVSTRAISSTLYDAFGQRQVSTIYNALNQYHVVMEVAPEYWDNPEGLKDIYVSTTGGAISGAQATSAVVSTTPLAAGAVDPSQAVRNQRTNAIAVSAAARPRRGRRQHHARDDDPPVTAHQVRVRHDAACRQSPGPVRRQHDLLQPGAGQDALRCGRLRERHHARHRHAGHHPRLVPGHGARLPAESEQPAPAGAGGARRRLYRARHPLRELHPPITILSTLPSAGIGALLALKITNVEFSLIAMIGVLLLIGIVKKNAIMMIDVALDRERNDGLEPPRRSTRPPSCASGPS
jgi:multidrug efflux pump